MTDSSDFPNTYDGLRQLIARLRGPDGCPWDREQTPLSLRPLLLEECYELIEAIDDNDAAAILEELGDVLFHLVLQVQVAEEAGLFDQAQVVGALIQKLIRRHPHVFGDTEVTDARQVEANWEATKRAEKVRPDASLLDGIPKNMPALSYARSIQERAARSGFDWEGLSGVLDKVTELLREMAITRSDEERGRVLGDVLFSVVNAARWMGMDPEGALRQTNRRFYQRFATMERISEERGLTLHELPLEAKESLWQEVMEG